MGWDGEENICLLSSRLCIFFFGRTSRLAEHRRPGIEPELPAVKHSLRHWTTREVPICLVLKQASREEGKVGSLRERMYSQLGQGLLASHLYPTDLFPRASHVPGIGEAEKRDLGPTPAPLGAQSSGEAQDNIQLPFFVVS